MNINEIKKVLLAFVNDPNETYIRNGRIVAQIQDDIIDVKLLHGPDGELRVDDDGVIFTPRAWILHRVARLESLAERLIAQLPPIEAFVTPSGLLRNDLSASIDEEVAVGDVVEQLEAKLSSPTPATTEILYLTSDAGEGKTTLINHLARLQAERYKARKSHWILLPVALGGKTFLRFDDVVIGTLSNKYRFNRYFFDGFIELVKLGAIIPAFDGFEEMFVEGHSGEAVSALGSFIESLDSMGSALVAARKAFFEITNFKTQARLFDAIGGRSASFARLKISRWKKQQFLDYTNLRGVTFGEELYNTFEIRLGIDHPLLSRAYLVEKLVDLAKGQNGVTELARDLGNTPQDYFFIFVETLVEREAGLKWLDKAGDTSTPLLTLAEHHQLLASIAKEMWQSSSDALRLDVIDVIVEMFTEPMRKGPAFVRQIRERVKNHSLLSTTEGRGALLEFDHDEFRRFYLGEALGGALVEGNDIDFRAIVSADRLPSDTCDQALHHILRRNKLPSSFATFVNQVARSSSPLSFARENCGALLIRVLSMEPTSLQRAVDSVVFPLNSLQDRELMNLHFTKCRFEPTSIGLNGFENVTFEDCEFERIDYNKDTSLKGATFSECSINLLRRDGGEAEKNLYGPLEIQYEILRLGGDIAGKSDDIQAVEQPSDEFIEAFEKLLRIFLRSTQVNEDTVRSRFGKNASWCVDELIPRLVRAKVMERTDYRGRGVQQRFKLAVPMHMIQDALETAQGSFDAFLAAINESENAD